MKPITLTMQAFGPYAKQEHIDFRRLENRTMFVISGKTGAGKTTIFDGISFAIYGRTSGEERTGTDLRSHFAPPSLLTEVKLHFELKGKQYKIIRSPQQEKKKERGDGFTTVNSKAEMYEIRDGLELLLADNVREVDEKVKEIMQLDFHQFRQILMIPQGEFRKLLTSDSKDKEQILQRLFHTQLFRSFQDRLKEEAGQLERQVGESRQERNKWLGSIEPLEHEELRELLLNDPINEELVISVAKNLVATKKEYKTLLNKELIIQQEKRDKLLKEIERANYIQDAFNRLAVLQNQQLGLINQQPEIDMSQKNLELAKQAERIWPSKKERDEKIQAVNERNERISRLKKDVEIASSEAEKAKTSIEELQLHLLINEENQQLLRELLSMEAKLNERKSIEKALFNIKNDGTKQRELMDQLERNVTAKREAFVQADQTVLQLSDVKIKVLEEREALTTNRYHLETMGRAVRHAEQLNQWSLRKEALLQDLTKQEKHVQKALAKKEEIDAKFFASQASVLAHTLEDGQPCPVCGSLDHPDRASGQKHVISDEMRIVATENWHKKQTVRDRIQFEYNQAKSRIEELEADKLNFIAEIQINSPHFKWEELESVKNELIENMREQEKFIQHLERDAERSKQALAQKEILQKELDQLLLNLENTKLDVQQKREQYIEVQADLKRLSEGLPEEYLNDRTYQTKINETKKAIAQFEEAKKRVEQAFTQANENLQALQTRLIQSEEELEKEIERMQKAEEIFRSIIEDSSFNTEEELVSARLLEAETNRLEQEIHTFEQQLYSTKEQLKALSEQLKDQEKPIIGELTSKLVSAEEKIEETISSQQVISSYIERHERLFEQLDENANATKKLEKEYALIGHLAEMANGKNQLRLTFERYVLAFYLEDILLVANERLNKMTSGRYELIRKEDKSKGNVQGGLELLVFDQYTGQQRHVKTLSGGEAFKASLSLALGLADVVQSHAGGVSLETMFIDEGFGTLDPESLDQAIESLIDIQSSGRVVGVISHVPELKERIDARLEVVSTQQGSTTEFHFTS
ncbi:AAA family ATPase [Jeotgalibacillus soli]|uniref:Nuclease SbcCD subunit C n=1 Tax=Jeotgalibacillus soli TaxID=889306 RepID=A0A0C2V8B7_9BACL|nr:SbcC/MukB-like Walker B domain-containing protein [Jeotgalibacillus soli]KIL45202.1 hypothetical protein KP78_27460 [Jeotgalibacillus soli]